MKHNICLVVEYLGTRYKGFQRQKNGISVQQVLEDALSSLTHEKISLTPSGRTDGGVHAMGQVVNFFSNTLVPVKNFPRALKHKLPDDIRVVDAFYVDDNFNARKSCIKKTYIYKMYIGKDLSVFDRGRVLLVTDKIDIEKMKEATKLFLGVHDFSSFCKSHASTKTTVREIYSCDLISVGKYLTLVISGNGFLYNMVRIIVGTLIDVGLNKLTNDDILSLLQGGKRFKAGKTVSPCGLYLAKAEYLGKNT